MREKDLLIFAPTYNEGSNISVLCQTALEIVPGSDFLVIDDNSNDGTRTILDQLRLENSRLKVIYRPRRMGIGSAHILAIHYAIENGYKILVTMDADLSHDPNDIPRLLEEVKYAGFVTGSRYMKGGSCDYSGYRKHLSKIANWCARRLLGIPLHEYTTSFRAFQVSMLKKNNLSNVHSHGYSFFMESVCKIYNQGVLCREIPIHFRDRKSGISKIPRIEIFRGMYTLMSLFISKFFDKKYIRRKSGANH